MDSNKKQPYITIDTLRKFGVTVSEQSADELIASLNETVEMRIGTEVIRVLNDAQLEELMTLQKSNTEGIGAWIAHHVPNYPQIIQDNIDVTIGEIAQNVHAINGTMN